MIVPRGAKFFPNQAPLLGMTIPTVEGNLRLGYSPRTKRRGMGLLLPVDPTVPQPRTNRRTIPVRGVGVSRGMRYRGLGDDGAGSGQSGGGTGAGSGGGGSTFSTTPPGSTLNNTPPPGTITLNTTPPPTPKPYAGQSFSYCKTNPPSSQTQSMITNGGGSISLIDCAPGTTTNPANPGGSFQNNPNAMIGTQPVEVLPPTPAYADCNPALIGEAASTACAAKNQQMQAAWITASGIARNNFNNAMCRWNGQPASYCDQVYPPGYSGGNSPTTQPIPIPGPLTAPPSQLTYNPVATFTTPNGQTPQVGDPWSISIRGAAPNAQVIVTQTINGGAPKSGIFGNADGSGNFAASGTFTPDTVGSWTESWSVGGTPAGSFNFQVVVPIPPPSGGNPPASKTPPSTPPPSTVPPTVLTGGGVPAGGGLNLGGFNFSSVPTWGWVAVAGVGAVLLFGGRH